MFKLNNSCTYGSMQTKGDQILYLKESGLNGGTESIKYEWTSLYHRSLSTHCVRLVASISLALKMRIMWKWTISLMQYDDKSDDDKE